MITNANLNSFLTLGYFLDYHDKTLVPVPHTNAKRFERTGLDELTNFGKDLLLKIFSDNFKENSRHLVPLSGGFDSRAIIGGLLRFTESRNIRTFTYGVPGSYDYEISKMLAKKYGLDHYAFNFETYDFKIDSLLDAAKRFRHQTMLFYHTDYRYISEHYGDHLYWSGFLGGAFKGTLNSLKWASPEMSNDTIKTRFLNDNCYVKSVYLANEPIENLMPLLDGSDLRIENVSLYERLDFFNRQSKYTGAHVCPEGFKIILPFGSQEWQDFICSIPVAFKKDLLLYKNILLNTFPELFSLPTKNNLGLSLNAGKAAIFIKKAEQKLLSYFGFKKYFLKKRSNYFDINEYIRNNRGLRNIMEDSLDRLQKRDLLPWINPTQLINEHIKGTADYGDAIQVLASLEIILTSIEQAG